MSKICGARISELREPAPTVDFYVRFREAGERRGMTEFGAKQTWLDVRKGSIVLKNSSKRKFSVS